MIPVNIYYVDDEIGLCEIFKEIFTSDTVKITTFHDPKEALKATQESTPDLFFIDFRMPNMTGEELAFALNNNIPKILVTGDLRVDLKYPFVKVISKPFDFTQIQSLIESI